ncbi:hypothetical protein OG596_17690 [Streptomyces sp. NBC_01102]|uniref:hypothetical protein n=1 Tax=unclassified Streptomyces TaxID=2593676 RepID=UPI00386A4F24|nr:hypothetical protein OG596_17690 [Streptomyces sp. NBC_01102]
MSRAQWCCLAAVLAVVLGLFCAPAATAAVPASGPVVAAAADTGIPGCDRNRDQDGSDPVLPARTRAAHDLAPGPVAAGLPAAAGRACPPAVRLAVRGPRPATPTPVELSVLRV